MKKIVYFLVLGFLLFGGCGKNNTVSRVVIAGLWDVSFTGQKLPDGAFTGTIELMQSNTDLTGTLSFVPVPGVRSEGAVTGKIIYGAVSIKYAGAEGFTLIMGGRATEEYVSGTFTLIYPPDIFGGPTCSGTFEMAKI